MKIERCPYCPKGIPKLACTDLGVEEDFQVWCHLCWAHGPSRLTKEDAVKDWNEVSLFIRGEELEKNATYILLKERDGQKVGQRIIYRWQSEDGKYNIFNPEGEADMQSAFSIHAAETKYYVGKI